MKEMLYSIGMPARNSTKIYINKHYYHVYNRGAGKQLLFKDASDYTVFLALLKRYLAPDSVATTRGMIYPNYSMDVELLAFCLMPNHFHLLLYQLRDKGITELMRSVCTSYSMYVNKKYDRSGTLYQGKFKASIVNRDSYLHHVSRYIHCNPADYQSWEYSSWPYYMGNLHASWLHPNRILELFDGIDDYKAFVADYIMQEEIENELAYELADH